MDDMIMIKKMKAHGGAIILMPYRDRELACGFEYKPDHIEVSLGFSTGAADERDYDLVPVDIRDYKETFERLCLEFEEVERRSEPGYIGGRDGLVANKLMTLFHRMLG